MDNLHYEKTFQSLFKHSHIGMALLNFDGRIISTNRIFQEMLGYSDIELKDQPLSLFIESEYSLSFVEGFQDLCDGKKEYFEMENLYYHRDKKTAWWRFNAFIVKDAKEDPQFIYGLIKDISRWKKSEVDLKKAKEFAEESTRTKSEFLANMSHEIRTPIHTITGMAELLMETDLDVEQKEYTEQVRFSADVLLSLINDILDFSKIEAGKLSLEVIDFDLYSMVESAVDLVVLEAHKKNLEVVVNIDPKTPHLLKGDPVRLRQIIVNLFNNAVKFTQEGEIAIFVELIENLRLNSSIKFSVRDTGIGISEEKLNRLFESFSQADSSTTRKYGGTGLGLSISKNLSEMMGGRVGVESIEGEGSTFWFTAVFERQTKDNIFQDVSEDFFEDLHILLVDDNQSARQILHSYLSCWGCQADEVENGINALKQLRDASNSTPYDLALIDLRMPGMDGWQLASEINSDKIINETKLILMTPTGLSGDEAKMMLLKWFDGYLGKPVKRRDLLATVFRVINSDIDLESIELDKAGEPEELLTEVLPDWQGDFNILVVEDHEVNQLLFRTILENIGYQVDLANDGVEAVKLTGQKVFHLIFMDIQMPNMNGLDATKKIREMGINTPIIAVTASALKEEMDQCFDAGMDDYLSKPFKKKDLLPILEKWLSQDEEHREQAGAETAATVESELRDSRIFNFENAVETFMGKEEVVIRVLSSFIQKVEDQLKTLEDAVACEDFDVIRAEAHSIKGGSWNLEAMELGDQAKYLEDAGREKQKQAAEKALSGIQDAFNRFKKAVALWNRIKGEKYDQI